MTIAYSLEDDIAFSTHYIMGTKLRNPFTSNGLIVKV